MMRQSIRLAFVAALQHLAPKQRAVLLLMEVLGWSAAEVAETLETTVAAVNSALQRARSSLANRDESKGELSPSQQEMLNRYVVAFELYDIDELVSLLQKDATLCMPPYQLWFQGPEAVLTWMLGMGSGCRGLGDSNFVFPVIFGALLWGGLWLRDGRVRDLLPVRAQ
jgi:RNA polymerase sigma-70 factor, ECF subfamily